jgi:hypothetical protein
LDTPSRSCCQRKEHRTTKVKLLTFIHCCILSYSSSCILWWHWLFKRNLGLVLAWKLGHKVPFLPLGRSRPLQTILLNDLFGCDSPLQIEMAFWHTFIVSSGLSHPTRKVWILIKRAPNCHYYPQMLSHPTGWAALPSDDISGRCFQGWRNPLMI